MLNRDDHSGAGQARPLVHGGDINRRELLQGGAGLAVAAGLAGCGVGSGDEGSKEDTEKKVKLKVDGDLVYFNWSEYLDPELIKDFEK